MSKSKTKIKTKDKLKPFSIAAGVLLALVAVLKVVMIVFDLSARGFLSALYGYSLAETIKYFLIFSVQCLPGLLFALLILIAAVILFVNKNSWVVFIPIGLLSYTLFSGIVSIFVNNFFAIYLGPHYFLNIIPPIVTLLISLVPALLITLVVCVLSATCCKRIRAVFMFVFFVLLGIAGVISIVLSCFTFTLSISNYMAALQYWTGIELLYYLYQIIVSPIISMIFNGGMLLGILLAAIGMISRPKAVETEPVEKIDQTDEPNTLEAL